MKVSISWLRELVDLRVPFEELLRLIPMRTIGTKEITKDFIELDMKGYNRADLLSMRGVAYEIAAITGSKVKFEELELEGGKLFHPEVFDSEALSLIAQTRRGGKLKVSVEDNELCPVYCVAKIENLKVEHSNEIWVKKLSDCGLRSVDNLTDVTNLVMLEYGQPLHAFDAKAVSSKGRLASGQKDETIVVRTAKQDERITTLDGKTRDLETSDLLIADPQNALGIAGVMGGKDSEVTSNTTTILLEAAIFDPSSLRKTATRLGISSEAAKRFYHGLTKKRLFQALSSAIKMYEQLGGTLTGLTIIDNLKEGGGLKKIKLKLEKVNSLIGVDISPEEVEGYLKKLNFTLTHPPGVDNNSAGVHLEGGLGGETSWEVTPPYWRLDINIEEDLVEEIARMFGYERIPSKKLSGKIPEKIDQSLFEVIDSLKKSLVEQGLTEVQTYSFYSSKTINNLELSINNLIKISNPISSETEYLRQDLWPNLLEKVAQNIRNGFSDIAIFEIGKVYHQTENMPKETYRLSIALSNGTDNPIKELYQIFTVIASEAKQSKKEIASSSRSLDSLRNDKLFHPTRFSRLSLNNRHNGGIIGEIHPRVVNKFGMDQRVAVLEIELKSLGV